MIYCHVYGLIVKERVPNIRVTDPCSQISRFRNVTIRPSHHYSTEYRPYDIIFDRLKVTKLHYIFFYQKIYNLSKNNFMNANFNIRSANKILKRYVKKT